MGYLVPPPPPGSTLHRKRQQSRPFLTPLMVREMENMPPAAHVLHQGPMKIPPPDLAGIDRIGGRKTGPIPGRPGQSVGVTFDPIGTLCDALVALLPVPTLPEMLTEDDREAWPNIYGDEAN